MISRGKTEPGTVTAIFKVYPEGSIMLGAVWGTVRIVPPMWIDHYSTSRGFPVKDDLPSTWCVSTYLELPR